MAYQSLYRRYRPRRFSEVQGQDHVVAALRNAVRDDRVSHAYLFSGPRGTGKTSTARILAKVLNCEHPADGEPDGTCDACVAVDAGTSYDVHELDAASNNGVDAMRDLIDRASLGTPGRTKVYILDEVHMLSKAAEAALLKTLEEPPPHVVFVLATTDPQKVSRTIVSRTQHLEFRLLATDVLATHVRHVIADAGLVVPDDAVEAVVRQGAGSARDTLSALDRIVASGVVEADESLDEIVEALADRDTGRALAALASASAAGRDARTLADRLVAQLRDGFLSLMAPNLVTLPDAEAARVADQAQRLGPAALVRAMEVIGTTLLEFRNAPDPRLLLDVALVKLTNADADASPAALLERIERLEKALADVPTAPASAPAGRAVLGGAKASARDKPAPEKAAPAPSPATSPEPAAAAPAGDPADLNDLKRVWEADILPALKPRARATFRAATVVSGGAGEATLALPNATHRDQCELLRAEVEAALQARFGRPVTLHLVVGGGRSASTRVASEPAPPDEHEDIDPDELVDASAGHPADPVARLTAAFPGAELVDDPSEEPRP